MDGISPRRAFELRDLGHELLALALRGSILEGDEAGRVMVALATVSAFTSAVLAAMLSFMLSLMRFLTAAARWCRQRGSPRAQWRSAPAARSELSHLGGANGIPP